MGFGRQRRLKIEAQRLKRKDRTTKNTKNTKKGKRHLYKRFSFVFFVFFVVQSFNADLDISFTPSTG